MKMDLLLIKLNILIKMSSKKYVPPAKRVQANKFELLDEPEEEVEQKKEEEFPTLTPAVVPKTNQWEGKRKFSEMAVQCELRAKEQKFHDEVEKSMQKNNYNNYLPKFDNIGRFIEPEDEYRPVTNEKNIEDDDGWTTVKNLKARKAKNIEEIANRPPTPEEKSDWDNDVPDDTDWVE
jgi:hypothetical protein